jgi:hypothetical protein
MSWVMKKAGVFLPLDQDPRYYYTEEGIEAAQRVFRKMFPQRPLSEWAQYLVFGPAEEAAPVDDDVLYDGQVAKRAVEYLESFGEKKEEPFFLAVGFIKPHSPYIAPKKYFDLYDRELIQLAKTKQWPAGCSEVCRVIDRVKRDATLISRRRGHFPMQTKERRGMLTMPVSAILTPRLERCWMLWRRMDWLIIRW